MRFMLGIVIVPACLVLATCGAQGTRMNPVGPSTAASLTGTWIGTVSDSTGSMMGAGLSAAMMSRMTWQITQTGNTFTGTMQFPGYGGHGPMTVSGTINGSTATFTMSIPSGGMMSGSCTATASGGFDINQFMTEMHGTYSGSNTCSGPFDHGQLSLSR